MPVNTDFRAHLRGLVQPDLLDKTFSLFCGSVAVSWLLNSNISHAAKAGGTVFIIASYHIVSYLIKLYGEQRLTDREAPNPESGPAPAPWGGDAALPAPGYGRQQTS